MDVGESLLSTLNEEQKAVVLYNEGPAMVIAGPGSGKTRALTHKIAYLILEKKVSADSVLAVTFTNKSAKEMKSRVTKLLEEHQEAPQNDQKDLGLSSGKDAVDSDLKDGYEGPGPGMDSSGGASGFQGVMSGGSMQESIKSPGWVGTFHSICARILRTEGGHIDILRNFVIYDTDDSTKLIKDIMLELNMSPKDLNPKAVMGAISKAKGEMITAEKFLSQASGSYFYERVGRIYPFYQQSLKDNNALDFTDLLFETVRLFEEHPDVLERKQEQFQHILIDEYQDTNRVQYYLVKMLARKHKRLTVVGDISQSIYSWRGADYRNMSQFEKDYPDAKVFQLARNYRSTEKIISAASKLIENNSTHIPIDLYTENGKGENILLYEAEHERAEAKYITDTISYLASVNENYEVMPEEGNDYSKFAVLYRTNAQSRTLEEAFLNEGIPYRIIGGVRFYDRKEIKDAISYLKVFHNPLDTVSWARCINTPPRKIGQVTFQKIRDSGFDLTLIEELTGKNWKKSIEEAQSGKATPLELLDSVLKDYDYLDYLNDGTEESLYRIENLKEFRSVANQYDSLEDFLENIALVESSNRAQNLDDNSVVLMTLHSAKGLEFDTVFLPGMEEGLFPHSKSMADQNELEEERRLCYVGITRAKEKVHMTYTRRRTYFGSTSPSLVSRFIAEIPEDLIEFRFS